ncbi:MAG: HU family DNA-binding protein [Salinivirgaceae bacterium]|nr:HU family DNA-binding protein [Salinivirgaceae bacterium]
MKSNELVATLAARSGLRQNEVQNVLNAFIEITKESLRKKQAIELVGFGVVYVIKRCEKIGRNSATGDPIKIVEKNIIEFRAAKDLEILVR